MPLVLAAGFGLAAVGVAIGGQGHPAGRWLAVHLFTLGVVTNLVFALSDHFARTLLRGPDYLGLRTVLALNGGVLLVLVGLPYDVAWLVAVGAVVLSAVVFEGYRRLRRMRTRAVGARFGFVVRGYERAHSGFLHGAVLGAAMGAGWLPGRWYAAGRLAHLHFMVLGWAGLTVLATMVFFGPTVLRMRIRPGAEATARKALPRAAVAVSVSSYALVATGAGGVWAAVGRGLAVSGLLVYAAAVTAVWLPMVQGARDAAGRRSASGRLLLAGCGWLLITVLLDAATIALAKPRLFDAVGVAALAGGIAQVVAGALGYLAPLVRGAGSTARCAIRDLVEILPRGRVLALNLGVALTVSAELVGPSAPAAAWVGRAGWTLVTISLAAHLLLIAPRGRFEPDRCRDPIPR